MLRAHANMPIDEFIAQLRTYVIAMGLSTQVVDCVDQLAGVGEIEDAHATAIREAADDAAVLMKNEILEAVQKWLRNNDIAPELIDSLLGTIEDI
jgi:hypothetical protein